VPVSAAGPDDGTALSEVALRSKALRIEADPGA
jgi:hypothetical protein